MLQLICNERPDYIPNVIQEDTITWLLTSHGNFTVKSDWNAFRELRHVVDWYRLIWHRDEIPRYSFYLGLFVKIG